MHRFGLALSGGGFRATLYHLGVVRCLRDAGVLEKVTHITTVSGGSILGAHLALNWDRYCGTPEEFDAAASELTRFIQLDVRNRIVRRFPFLSVANRLRSIMLMSPRRQWTRAGLLERYYERHLYGDTPLSMLPDRPSLHILSTNLSEGCLCSFNQRGLLVQRRAAGRRDRFDQVQVGLATVPMAVAASSCFPGFFPPLELSGWDVGADLGEFRGQAFTDGGVYDNLGLRMFKCLEQSWSQHGAPLRASDFLELDDAISALRTATELPEGTPLRRLRRLIDKHIAKSDTETETETGTSDRFAASMIGGLWDVIRSERLFLDPSFAHIELEDPSAQSLLIYARDSGREPSIGDSLWLNRTIVEAALRQVIGKPCLRMSREAFDGILVSDAGGKFKVSGNTGGGGLISTALRSSDILMNRVWQLENEVFENTQGIVIVPITDIVDRHRDPMALDPECQRQASRIRTDLDRFSDLEIDTLARHGYCVTRQVLRRNEDLVEKNCFKGAPWSPISSDELANLDSAADPSAETLSIARKLRASSKRKIVTTIFDLRDWPSYVWLLLILGAGIGLTYFNAERSDRLRRQETVLTAVAQLNPDYQKIIDLLDGPIDAPVEPLPVEDVDQMADVDNSGFDIASESRVFDLRTWEDPERDARPVSYSVTRLRRLPDVPNNTILRMQRVMATDQLEVQCTADRFEPQLLRMPIGDNLFKWELRFDMSHVPLNTFAEIKLKSALPKEAARRFNNEARFNFSVQTRTGLLQVWLLLPEGSDYDLFEVSSYPIGHPEKSEIVVPAAVVRMALESVATFRLINPEPRRQYECRWVDHK